MQEEAGPPRGRVRVTMPVTFGLRHVSPILPEFMEAYPHITLEVDFSDHSVDLVAQGYDLALRISALVDSSMKMRHLCKVPRFLVASPTWIERHRAMTHPRDLGDHLSVVYQHVGASPTCLRLHTEEGELATVIPRRPRIVSNNADVFLPFLEKGEGVGLLPAFMADGAIKAGRLVKIMPQWQSDSVALHILTPPNAQRPARVSVFIEWLVSHFKKPCWE
nr:substrate binding domain-containing protein [Saccharibacter sp. 17.LH.SD]